MNKKTTAVLIVIVVMLIVAVAFTLWAGRSINKKDDVPEDMNSEPEITVIDPSVIAPSPSPSPLPQQEEKTEPAPETSPEPSPEPTPEPPVEETKPVVSAAGSGSFKSDSGAKINIRVEYNWRSSEGASDTVEVSVKVLLDSYSLHLSAVPKSVIINLGGQYISLDAPAVDYDGSELLTTTLAEKTFTADIPADGRLSLSVEWLFGGTYSGIELDSIECSGTVDLN